MLWHIAKGCTPLQYVMSQLGSVPVYTSRDGVYMLGVSLTFPGVPMHTKHGPFLTLWSMRHAVSLFFPQAPY